MTAQAYQAIWQLVAVPSQAVSLLQRHLQVEPIDPQRLPRLIAELNDVRFFVREQATTELENYGELATVALRKILKEQPSLEVRRRAERILERLQNPTASPLSVRRLRCIEVLEHIGNEKAVQVLHELANSKSETSLTREAQAALDRWARRNSKDL